MLFNSLQFLVFLPLVVVLYYVLPFRFRWILIFLASCWFYMAFVPKYILILFFIILLDYSSGLLMERLQGKARRLCLWVSLLSNILLLCVFKYYGFICFNLDQIWHFFGNEFHAPDLALVLPIGLSFHTFQSMSYTIEVYRGRQKAERHLGYFANYVLFFPQMVAGPIERYEGLGNELKKKQSPVYDNFSNGFRLILFGLFVKMCIADNLAIYVNQIYSDPRYYSPTQVLLAIFFFSFQIYADFYGYSTVAVGAARLLGIRIMDNFQTPYLSRSVTEFWSRWHISLSTWFRDYLYIPLGGNRVSVPRWCINVLIVFLVSGLWHGANWTFVVWGATHGLCLLLERLFSSLTGRKAGVERSAFVNGLLTIKTFVLVSFAWIFFRAESFVKVGEIFEALSGHAADAFVPQRPVFALLLCALLILSDIWIYRSRADMALAGTKPVYRWAVYTLLLFGVLALSGTQKYAFIYFQF